MRFQKDHARVTHLHRRTFQQSQNPKLRRREHLLRPQLPLQGVFFLYLEGPLKEHREVFLRRALKIWKDLLRNQQLPQALLFLHQHLQRR